jgi:hypothetical protein
MQKVVFWTHLSIDCKFATDAELAMEAEKIK